MYCTAHCARFSKVFRYEEDESKREMRFRVQTASLLMDVNIFLQYAFNMRRNLVFTLIPLIISYHAQSIIFQRAFANFFMFTLKSRKIDFSLVSSFDRIILLCLIRIEIVRNLVRNVSNVVLCNLLNLCDYVIANGLETWSDRCAKPEFDSQRSCSNLKGETVS